VIRSYACPLGAHFEAASICRTQLSALVNGPRRQPLIEPGAIDKGAH